MVDRPSDNMLVVLIPATVFSASSESELFVTFENGPAGQVKVVKIWLSPYSPVPGDTDPHSGMQMCEVIKFRIPPTPETPNYHPNIGTALTMPKQLRIKVTDYKRGIASESGDAPEFF